MNSKFKIVLLAVAGLALNACAVSVPDFTIDSGQAEIGPAPADKAQIVFFRVSHVLGAISADIFEYENETLDYVGKVKMTKKIVHHTTPGKEVYMARGTASDFMFADVEAGKTYYVLLRPNWGSGAFIPTPIKRDGTTNYHSGTPEFPKWLKKTKMSEMKSAEAGAWYSARKDKFQLEYDKYWAKFETKSDEQKKTRTLMPSDGE